MNSRTALAVGVALATWTLGSSSAWAQRGFFGGGPTFTMDDDKTRNLMGSVHELGPKAADLFKAWSVARLEGAEYFTKDQDEIRAKYLKVGRKISKAVVEDRLQESAGRQYFTQLLKIGQKNREAPEVTEASLEALESSVHGAIVDNAKAETLTPRLNSLQWLIGEIALYAKDTSALSSGRQSSIKRKLLALEEREGKLKKGGALSDRDRKKLMEGGIDIWKIIVEGLRKE